MENLNFLWEYQKKDIELENFKNQLQNTPTRKRLLQLQRYLKSSQQKVNEIEERILFRQNTVGECERQYGVIVEDMEDLSKDIGYFSECDAQDLNRGEIQDFVKTGRQLSASALQLKKDMTALRDEINETDKMLRELLQKMRAAKKEYDILKVEHRKEIENSEEETKILTASVSELEKKLPPALINEYKRIKGFRPMPVAKLEDSRCTGCNMQLPSGMAASVAKSDKLILCENCGRILIVI